MTTISRLRACATALALSSIATADSSSATRAPATPSHSATSKARPAAHVARTPAPAPGDSLRLDPLVRVGVLPDGMRYYIRRNAKPEARVSLRLAVGVGSTAETDDQQGLAHFAEHMNFNGSPHFKSDELWSYLRSIGLRLGADANAYTSFDETVYMLEVPTDRDTLLDRGLTVLADFAGAAALADSEIDKERGVVLEEWRLGQGASDRIRRQQFPVMFHGSLYAERLPIGKPEIIEKGPHERLRAFYHDWYTPDHMALVAVGDVDPARMDSLIRVHFASVAKSPEARRAPLPDIPPHRETLYSIATDREATGSFVQVLYKRARRPYATVADFRRGLIDNLFRSMLNARFSEIAHKADAPFLFAGWFSGTLGRSGEYSGLGASVADGGIAKGLAAILAEAARVRAHGFLASEFERAKSDLEAEVERGYAEREKSESRLFAGQYVATFLSGDPAPGVETSYRLTRALLPGITLAEVTTLGEKLIHDDNRVILAAAPEKVGLVAPTEPELRAVLAAAESTQSAAWEDKSAGKSLMTELPTPGTVRERRTIDEIGATVLTLSNGVEVWLKPTQFKADEIVFSSYGLGGASLADSADYGDAALAAPLVGEGGVGGFTSTEIEKLLAGKIAGARAYLEDYTQGVSGSCRPQDLETALQLAYLTITKPTESQEAAATFQKRLRSYVMNRANSPDAVFGDSVTAINTGDFYMDRPLSQADLEHFTSEKALRFYRERFANAADLTFFFVGSFQLDDAIPLIARYLGGLPSSGVRSGRFLARGPSFPAGVRRARVAKGLEPKSATQITFAADVPLEELPMHRARAAASILADRLREILREELGATYGVSVNYSGREPLSGHGTMSIGFGSAPENVERMMKATLGEIERLRSEGPSAVDVSKDQEVERRELEVGIQRNSYWMGSMQTMHMMGFDARRIAKRRERIDLLTVDNLHETFRKCFPADRYTVVSLYPESGQGASAGEKPSGAK